MSVTELVLPAPLPHQAPVLEHPARFKVGRCGRRWGKSRLAVLAATAGHGPGRCWPGILQGGQVAWIGPDYKQTAAIWREEIRPRFAGLPWATVRESERRVEVAGLGALELLSAENIDALRGRKFDGVVCDEGAHFDLEYAWSSVIRPALADRQGWAIFISTPHAGHDGNSAKVTPSYFNRLVTKVEAGEYGPEWLAWHGRTEDNPKLPAGEVAAMRAEYPPDSPTVQQEFDALLVAGGLMAFPEVTRERHVVPAPAPKRLPGHWTLFGAFDWGYDHPYSFGLYAVDEGGRCYGVDATSDRRKLPPSIAQQVGALLEAWGLTFRDLAYTTAGRDVFTESRARGESGPTLHEQFIAHGWVMVPANTARIHGRQNAHAYLAPKDGRPRFVWYDTPGNRAVLACVQGLVTDPKNPEDVLKVDADRNGQGGDDPYDQWRYALMSRPLDAKAPKATKHEDQADRPRWRQAPEPAPARPVRPSVRPPWLGTRGQTRTVTD